MDTTPEQISYTVINHTARLALGLSINEYCVADLIYHLANNPKGEVQGWCYASKEAIGKMLGLTKRGVNKIISKLIKQGLVERNPSQNNFLRITFDWYEATIIDREQSSRVGTTGTKGGNKVPEMREQSSHYKYNNKDIKNNVVKKSSKEIEYWAQQLADILNDEGSISYFRGVCKLRDPMVLISKAKEIVADGQAKNPAAVFVAWLKEKNEK